MRVSATPRNFASSFTIRTSLLCFPTRPTVRRPESFARILVGRERVTTLVCDLRCDREPLTKERAELRPIPLPARLVERDELAARLPRTKADVTSAKARLALVAALALELLAANDADDAVAPGPVLPLLVRRADGRVLRSVAPTSCDATRSTHDAARPNGPRFGEWEATAERSPCVLAGIGVEEAVASGRSSRAAGVDGDSVTPLWMS